MKKNGSDAHREGITGRFDAHELPAREIDPDTLSPDFVVLRVGWITQNASMQEMEASARQMFRTLIDFLQANGLTTREILSLGSPVTDDTEIRIRDLTREGRLLMRRPHDKWIGAVDQGMDPNNTTILESALARIRSGRAGKFGE